MKFCLTGGDVQMDSNNNNNNYDNRDDIYGAVIMAEPLREFTRFQLAANPQTKPIDLDCESARKKWQLPSASTIAIYYYLVLKLTLILPSHGG